MFTVYHLVVLLKDGGNNKILVFVFKRTIVFHINNPVIYLNSAPTTFQLKVMGYNFQTF